MAQSVYSGLQGHGKSYEVVKSVIVPNVAKGRRVVTNVAGLQIDKINAYCVEKLGADPEKLGEIVHVTNERLLQPGFFPVEGDSSGKSVVQGGDVVIIDECWRFYVTGEKLNNEHLTFFRMHRHFTHPETGQSCDIVLIVQDIGDLQRKILATVEKSFLMKKHKDLGFSDRYVVTVFAGKKQTASALTEEKQHKYDPEIFALYQSYSQAQQGAKVGVEEQADKRGNLFNRGLFKYGLPLAFISICGGSFYVWKFFHPEPKTKPAGVAAAPGEKIEKGKAAPGTPATPEVKAAVAPGVSEKWRLVGQFGKAESVTFILADEAGRTRYVIDPPGYKVTRSQVELALPNGEIVTSWSGTAAPSLLGKMK